MVQHLGESDIEQIIEYVDSKNRYKVRRVIGDTVRIKIYEEDISDKFTWNCILEFRNNKTGTALDKLSPNDVYQFAKKKIQVYCKENKDEGVILRDQNVDNEL